MNFANTSAFSFPKDKKDPQIKSSNPGPGSYNPNHKQTLSNTCPQWVVSKSARVTEESKILNSPPNSPGPAAYSVICKMSPNKLTFGPKYTSKYNANPGPGEYAPNFNLNASSLRYSQYQTDKELNPNRSITPGPGQYDLRKDNAFDKNFTKYGTEQRTNILTGKEEAMKMPAPGHYELKSFTSNPDGPKHSFGDRTKEVLAKYNVGPGQYDVKVKNEGPQYSFKEKIEMKPKDGPGPGSYEVTKTTKNGAPSYQIPKSFRETTPIIQYMEKLPGPGQYENTQKITSKGVKFDAQITREKYYRTKSCENIGPGLYESNNNTFGSEGNKYTMYNRIEEQKTLDVPGPGSYNSDKLDLVKASSQKWKVPISIRENKEIEPDRKKIVPGPGAYESENKIATHKKVDLQFSRGEKIKAEKSFTPGPGSYQIKSSIGIQQR